MTKQCVVNNRRSFFQLAGHKECFKLGLRSGTILKKSTDNEEECLVRVQQDLELARFVPRVYGTVDISGQTFLEMQDLLYGFDNASVMDVKMGYRTYREEELYKALRDSQLRHDMFDKMIEVDESEPTTEERRLRAVTKPRYMIWRESVSSTASLGFRVEGMRLRDGTIDKDFKTIKEEEQIAKAFIRYTKSLNTRLDFAKTHSLPEDTHVTHVDKWELGNHEDGYMAGIENLIKIFELISTTSATPEQQQQRQTTITTTPPRSDQTPMTSKRDSRIKNNTVCESSSSLKLEIRTS